MWYHTIVLSPPYWVSTHISSEICTVGPLGPDWLLLCVCLGWNTFNNHLLLRTSHQLNNHHITLIGGFRIWKRHYRAPHMFGAALGLWRRLLVGWLRQRHIYIEQ
jgi:hypothetical protein